MRPQVIMRLSLILLFGCGGASLPPEAFGVFVETNNQAFDTKLDVRADGVTLFVAVALPGMAGGRPLACRGEAPGGVQARMNLSLDCAGERVPYEFEYRAGQGDWVASEPGSTPQIFVRR